MARRFAMHALLLVAVGWCFTGCTDRRLILAEQLMETNVEAADSLIYSMDLPAGKSNRALYSMLKTQIDYKMYREAQNDNTIRIATDYYGNKYKDYHAAMAWYTLGCISAELGQDSTATDAYLTALSLFPDTLVRYYALAEQNLSYIFLDHNMEAEAIQMIKSCRENAIRLNDSAAIAFCDYNIAFSLLCNFEYDKAKQLFWELKDNAWLSPDTKDDPWLQLSKIVHLAYSDYNQSLNYVDSFFIRNNHQQSYGTAYSIKADAYYGLQLIDSAQLYYHLSLTEPSDPYTVCDAYRRLSEIQTLKGNKDSATYYIKQASAWMDTIALATDSGVLYRIINRFTLSSFKPKSKTHIFYNVLIVVLCVSAISILSYKHYRKKPKSIADFAHDLELFKQSDLYQKMINVTNQQIDLTGMEREAIEQEFQTSLPSIRKFIISKSKHLTSIELDFCIFTLAGFKQRDFVLFFVKSYSGIRNYKARLKDKMPESIYNEIFS